MIAFRGVNRCIPKTRVAVRHLSARELDPVDFLTIRKPEVSPTTKLGNDEEELNKNFGKAVSDLGSGFTRGEVETIGSSGLNFSGALKKRGIIEDTNSDALLEMDNVREPELNTFFSSLLQLKTVEDRVKAATVWLEEHFPEMSDKAEDLVNAYSLPVIVQNAEGSKFGTFPSS